MSLWTDSDSITVMMMWWVDFGANGRGLHPGTGLLEFSHIFSFNSRAESYLKILLLLQRISSKMHLNSWPRILSLAVLTTVMTMTLVGICCRSVQRKTDGGEFPKLSEFAWDQKRENPSKNRRHRKEFSCEDEKSIRKILQFENQSSNIKRKALKKEFAENLLVKKGQSVKNVIADSSSNDQLETSAESMQWFQSGAFQNAFSWRNCSPDAENSPLWFDWHCRLGDSWSLHWRSNQQKCCQFPWGEWPICAIWRWWRRGLSSSGPLQLKSRIQSTAPSLAHSYCLPSTDTIPICFFSFFFFFFINSCQFFQLVISMKIWFGLFFLAISSIGLLCDVNFAQ